ncbi:AraC family transcriptional regulator [Mammaliicoccus lentus]|uniref:AraC family transcriptional regulator n=1 Tax=Mammaliicoccus lentus TaxID=42858 RepID=UPI001B337664|nr:AraC family transcriptional regulator [Mammaliicoccus lentus]
MYNEIIIEETREELVQYPDKQWKHIILHTILNKTLFGYIPIHWHHALQFVYVINGKLNITIADKSIYIGRGDALFINSNVVHEITEHTKNTEFFCWNVELPEMANYIEFDYVTYITKNVSKLPYIYLSSSNDNQRNIIQMIKKAGEIYEQQPHFKLDITIKYYEILKWIINVLEEQKGYIEYYFDTRVKKLIAYIQEHFNSKMTLDTFSKQIHMSHSETIKLFKQHVKQTPFQYLLNVRLEQSIRMLHSLHFYTITEVAMNCGFSTTSYFIQVFKNKYGLTPKQFQKRAHLDST